MIVKGVASENTSSMYIHPLRSLRPSSPQWLVQSNKYLGRPALQVGLRDVEIGERQKVALCRGRCTKYLSRAASCYET